MQCNEIVSPESWTKARLAFLLKEKEFQKARDDLASQRRALPWMRVGAEYIFDTTSGPQDLAGLFEGREQLIVWHFMFGRDWDEGCPSCSFWADHYSPAVAHLNQRDVSLVAVSTAPLKKLLAYRKRMGWAFNWVSAGDNSFNQDFAVTFSPEEVKSGDPAYNFGTLPACATELPGISVFAKGDDGAIYRTYSSYARGIDPINAAYQQLDLVPKGRDEDGLPHPMAWLRRHDQYRDTCVPDGKTNKEK
jgi:predicted dithiol-disulfide oxidoreductase (DUF899 family)